MSEIRPDELEALEMEIIRRGPTRVVTAAAGKSVTAQPPGPAKRLGVRPEIIFIRMDGWSLGAELKYEKVAFDQWPDEWRWFWRAGLQGLYPIARYQGIVKRREQRLLLRRKLARAILAEICTKTDVKIETDTVTADELQVLVEHVLAAHQDARDEIDHRRDSKLGAGQEIWLSNISDHHSDPSHRLFLDRSKAIEHTSKTFREMMHRPHWGKDQYEIKEQALPKGGVRWSAGEEGDHATVTKVAIE